MTQREKGAILLGQVKKELDLLLNFKSESDY
jgi:hypothetical protein